MQGIAQRDVFLAVRPRRLRDSRLAGTVVLLGNAAQTLDGGMPTGRLCQAPDQVDLASLNRHAP